MVNKDKLIINIIESDLSSEDKNVLIEIVKSNKPENGDVIGKILIALDIGKELLDIFGLNDCGG